MIVDVAFGFLADWQKKIGLKGDYRPIEYIMKECNEDVLIMGSSVALNSFIPSIIEDTLGLSCFNAGANGQTMIYYHTMLNIILKRYCPKIIVLGLHPSEFKNDKIMRYNILTPYFNSGYKEIDSVIIGDNPYDKYLLNFNLYRYNTVWFRILLYNFVDEEDVNSNGFIGKEKPAVLPIMSSVIRSGYVSASKLDLFKDIIQICKNHSIKLLVVTTPSYSHLIGLNSSVECVKEICFNNGIRYYDDTELDIFLKHADWFYDTIHLNIDGAKYYSKIIASRLKDI